MLDKPIETTRLAGRQSDIYEGLRQIGQEVADLYFDGVKIFSSRDFNSKPYLLAHVAREIEGSLRDIFASNKTKTVEAYPPCDQALEKATHIDTICQALGVSKNDRLARDWHNIADKFHKYAHRRKPWGVPRDKESFDELWTRFETILHSFVGTYLSLLKRVDHLLQHESPTGEIIGALSNMLLVEARATYFFRKLSSPSWLRPLLDAGYFSPARMPQPRPADEEGYVTIPLWNVLPYLEQVSKQVNDPGNEKYIDELLKIIREVTQYRIEKGKSVDNYHTWTYFVRILVNIPNSRIPMDVIGLIPTWLASDVAAWALAHDLILELLPKFLPVEPSGGIKRRSRNYSSTCLRCVGRRHQRHPLIRCTASKKNRTCPLTFIG